MEFPYFGNWPAIAGLIAAFAVTMPREAVLSFVLPISARGLLALSVGITVLSCHGRWVATCRSCSHFPLERCGWLPLAATSAAQAARPVIDRRLRGRLQSCARRRQGRPFTESGPADILH